MEKEKHEYNPQNIFPGNIAIFSGKLLHGTTLFLIVGIILQNLFFTDVSIVLYRLIPAENIVFFLCRQSVWCFPDDTECPAQAGYRRDTDAAPALTGFFIQILFKIFKIT